MTDPMTPPECDLRGLPFMPLDVVRLGDSDLFALASGEEFKAAVALWCKAWLQVPAASLPDDPRILAHLSGTGARWSKVSNMALRGWVKCSDGRLYHPVVAEKAREAWRHREAQRARANKRWQNGSGNPDDSDTRITEAMPAQSPGDAAAYPAAMQGTGTVKKEEERTTSLRSVDAVPASFDARTDLFQTGLATVRRLTGLPDGRARALLGKCLKASGDNATIVSDAIARCADTRPADAVPWLIQACDAPKFRNGFLAVIAEEGWTSAQAEPDDPPNQFLLGGADHGPH